MNNLWNLKFWRPLRYSMTMNEQRKSRCSRRSWRTYSMNISVIGISVTSSPVARGKTQRYKRDVRPSDRNCSQDAATVWKRVLLRWPLWRRIFHSTDMCLVETRTSKSADRITSSTNAISITIDCIDEALYVITSSSHEPFYMVNIVGVSFFLLSKIDTTVRYLRGTSRLEFREDGNSRWLH